jgi:chromosome segregation ATPase
MVERNRLQNDVDLIRTNHQQELSRLHTELAQAQQALTDLSLTKGSEVQNLVNRFSKDHAVLEGLLSERQADIARLGGQLADALRDHDKLRSSFEEEKMVLQAGLDQALEMLKMHQDESQSGMGQRDERIAILEGKHRDLLFQMMGSVLCIIHGY